MSDLLTDVRFEIQIAIDAELTGEALANAIIARLCRRIGGGVIHWPKKDRFARNGAIFSDAKAGFSRPEIARRNDVTLRTVDRVLRYGGPQAKT